MKWKWKWKLKIERNEPAVEIQPIPKGVGLLVARSPISKRRLSKTASIALWCCCGVMFGTSIFFRVIRGMKTASLNGSPGVRAPSEKEMNGQAQIEAPPVTPVDLSKSGRAQPQFVAAPRGPFLKPQLIERPKGAAVPPGTLALAKLVSGASNGPVKAVLTESIYVDGDPVLDEGTVLLGSGASTEERLFVRFGMLVLRDGKTEKIQAEAADFGDKIAGLKGSRVGARALKLAGSIGLNFVSGMSEVLQDQKMSPMGMPIKDTSMKNAFLNGTEKAAADEAEDILSGIKEAKPIIEVGAGTPIFVLFGEGG